MTRLDELLASGDDVVDVPTAGAVLGLGRAASYEAARRGEIPVLHRGRRRLVPVRLFAELLGATTPHARGGAPQDASPPTAHQGAAPSGHLEA